MPTYEYQCTRCNHICEEFKPISAPKRQRCPLCRSKVERLISGGLGIHFKGSGFYATDSRPKSDSAGDNSAAAETGSTTSNSKKSASEGSKS